LRGTDIFEDLRLICGKENVEKAVSMKEYTSMKVGGIADYVVQPDSIEKIKKCTRFLTQNNINYMVIGNGTNLIFADEGYRGVIIKINSKFADIEVKNNYIIAQSGALLTSVANMALENSLTGLEFASGIPGTIGGAAYMNAGAYGGEMKHVITETVNLDKKGNIVTLKGDEHNFCYRSSRIQDDELICLMVTIKLQKGDYKNIHEKMTDFNRRRREKQPLDVPSAGSTFKRPPGNFAGKLIEECGLRGFQIGGAKVSEKHCGFIINTGNASSADIICLIKHIQKTVSDKTGVLLEPELKIVGGK
jgi:UDP-N-acetylmuramate dehydrogenase